MSIARVGSTSAASATLSSPTGAAGDVIIWYAYRSASATAPSLPAGTASILSGGANTNSLRVFYEFCTATSASSRTATNATQMIAVRYSGVFGIGNISALSSLSGTTVTFAAATLLQSGGASWWVAVAAHRTATNVNTAPSGMTNITSVGTGPMLAAHDTNAATSSNWTSTNVTVNASSGDESAVIELLGGTETFSPYDFTAAITLSSGNKTATSTASPPDSNGIRCFRPRATGKYGFKFTVSNYGAGGEDFNFFLGLATQATVLNTSPGIGNSTAINFGTTTRTGNAGWFNHTNTNNSGSYGQPLANGDVVYLVFDLDNGLCWAKTTTITSWNNNGSANPDTGVGGFAYTDIVGSFLIPYFVTGNNAAAVTIELDDISGASLSTFNAWDRTAASGFSGTVTAALASFTTAISGDVARFGTVAAALAPFALPVAGRLDETGTLAASLPQFAAAVGGVVGGVSGTAAMSLPGLGIAVSGHLDESGTIAASLAAFQMQGLGHLDESGTVVASMPGFTIAVSGSIAVSGVSGAIAAALPGLVAAANGHLDETGTVSASLASLGAVVTGSVGPRGTVAAALAGLTLAATGKTGPQGTAGLLLPGMGFAGTGRLDESGQVVATLAALTMAVAGNVPVSGTINASIPAFAFTANGNQGVTGTIVSVLPVFGIDARQSRWRKVLSNAKTWTVEVPLSRTWTKQSVSSHSWVKH